MKLNGYLFNAGVTLSQMLPVPGIRGGKSLQTWDTCVSAIVYGGDAEPAQKTFEDWCRAPREGEEPMQVVASWLWWRFAANTPFAANEILVSPCCGIIPAS